MKTKKLPIPWALGLAFSCKATIALAGGQVARQEVPVVIVQGNPGHDYRAATAESTTRTSADLKDLPASIQVVPREVLNDRGVTRTDQLLENVSGVLAESTYGGNGATFFNIRGFSENNGLRDGFRNYGYLAFRDVQNIERVEVFKGPAGALYGGVGAVGGYVNTVSKRPLQENFGEIGATLG
jgi:iron complex outermembrane receptor protein